MSQIPKRVCCDWYNVLFNGEGAIEMSERKKPELHVLAICQSTLIEPNGFVSLIRIVDKFIHASTVEVPTNTPLPLRFEIFTRWANGTGDYTERLFVIGPTGKRSQLGTDHPFRLTDVRKAQQIRHFTNLAVGQTGDYWLEVFLDDDADLSQPYGLGSKYNSSLAVLDQDKISPDIRRNARLAPQLHDYALLDDCGRLHERIEHFLCQNA